MNSSENINPNNSPLGAVPSVNARRPSLTNTHNPKKIEAPAKRIASCMTGAALAATPFSATC